MTPEQFQALAATIVQLINAGVAIEGVVASAIKSIIAAFHSDPTDAQIDAQFAAILAEDTVIEAKAAAQAGLTTTGGSVTGNDPGDEAKE